jgi:Family of unknown function (DUF6160)
MTVMKRLLISSLVAGLSVSVSAMQAIDDESLGAVTGQDGVDVKIALTSNIDNVYFETDGNRVNFGNIAIDTDTGLNGLDPSSNRPFEIKIDAVNSGFRKGLEMAISDVNSLSATVRDMSLSQSDGSNSSVFGSIGIENINFNGGTAEAYVIGRAGVGNQGIETGFSLPDGTTLDFTINDYEYASSDPSEIRIANKGGQVRATIEINDFFVGQTIDVVDLGDGDGRALRMIFTGLEGAFDITNLTAGDGSIYKGGFGRVQIDGMQMNRGYLIVDALPN